MSSILDGNVDVDDIGVISGGVTEDISLPSESSSEDSSSNPAWWFGAKVYLKTVTQLAAIDHIRTDTLYYEGKILSFGYTERSIGAPVDTIRVGDFQIRLDDKDLRWRTLAATNTLRRRLIELVRIADDELLGGFEIIDVEFGDGYCELRGSDLISKLLRIKIPNLIDRVNFPWLRKGLDSAFMPIIVGDQFSSVDNLQGMVDCPHMGTHSGYDRFAASRFPLYSPSSIVVYRKTISDNDFSIVTNSPAEYVITTGETFTTVNGKTYYPVYVDFIYLQGGDTKIRIDTYGIAVTPSIGDIPSSTWGIGSPNNRPIDGLLTVLDEVRFGNGPETQAARYATSLFVAERALEVTLDMQVCFTIASATTFGQFLSRLQQSTQIDVYINKGYQLAVSQVLSAPAVGELYALTDNLDFDGIKPLVPNKAVNRYEYRWGFNTSANDWQGSAVYNVDSDQAELGNSDYQGNADAIEPLPVDLYYIKDSFTAETIIVRRSRYERLGSNRVEFRVSTVKWFDKLELGMLIAITHYGGIKAGGWTLEIVKVLSLRHDLERMETTVGAIVFIPIDF